MKQTRNEMGFAWTIAPNYSTTMLIARCNRVETPLVAGRPAERATLLSAPKSDVQKRRHDA